MKDLKEKRALEIQDAIRQILYRDWDPIGVCGAGPQDEYDNYIGAVYRILNGSRSEDALVDFLRKTESESMGLDSAPLEHLRPVAQKLLKLNVRL